MSIPKNLVGWGGAGVASALTALAATQNLSISGGNANTPLPVPGLVTGMVLVQTYSLDVNGKPFSPQPVFTVTYAAGGAQSSITSPSSTANGTIRVTYAPAARSTSIAFSSLVGKGVGISTNAVPAPTQASPSGYAADLGAVQADAKPTPAAEAYPTANFTSVVNHEVVAFTDTTTYSDGAAFEWLWDFGDNVGFSHSQNPSYTYAAPGTYNVKLQVTDANGHQASVVHAVTSVA